MSLGGSRLLEDVCNMNTNQHDLGGLSWTAIGLAALFLLSTMLAAQQAIGLPPVIIVGGSGVAALVLWVWSYRGRTLPPEVILPPFLLTVACLEIHMIEEYLTGFGPAMSRLFDISWTERGFLLVFAFIGPALYALTALGLYKRIPVAGFVACFIFIGPGVAEFSHFLFPFIRPAIEPCNLSMLTQTVSNGHLVADMRNYYIDTTGRYYFPGLYTAILPMIPGIYGLYAIASTRLRKEASEIRKGGSR